MNRFKIIIRILAAAFLLFGMVFGTSAFAKKGLEDKGKDNKDNRDFLSKTNAYQPERYQLLNINNLWAWHREDGHANHSPTGDNGTFFPRGTSFIIYQDGLVWGSQAYLDADHTQPAPFGQTIRVGGATYGTGTFEGRIIGEGATAVRADQDDPLSRIFRIRRDWKEMARNLDGSFSDELTRDTAESNEIASSSVTDAQNQKVLDEYAWSWNNWPVQFGAPYIDRNGNGVYDPPPAGFVVDDLIAMGYDEPGIAGADPDSPADQVMWTVFNDLDRARSTGRFGSEPTGLEIQMTMWAYKRTDALGNIFFRKWTLINKGGIEIDANGTLGSFYLDSMYVCQWSDPDLGSFSDDLVGTDTTLNLGFVYNGNAIDTDFRKFNLPPPSGGYDYLQGPAVPDPGGSGIFNLKIVPDIKNLGMTGFSYFSAGSPYSDPGGGYATNTIQWYKMLRGFAPLDGADVRYNHPPGVTAGQFPLAGDPVTQTGHIDGQGFNYSFVPGDRRLLIISGPFQMAPGDVQEVVVAFVAGLGSDRLSSVAVMKFNDRFAQNTYDALFQVPSAPASPSVVTTELDGRVTIEWGSDLVSVSNIEDKINEPGSFKFEGYNFYQLVSPSSSLSDAKRVFTVDLKSDPAVVLDQTFDLESGQILEKAVQFGSNSGIQRFFELNRDHIKDVDKLNNGEEYYIAVTAYSVAQVPGFLPASLESPPQVITVVPKVPFGTNYQTDFGEILEVTHAAGGSFGFVEPLVVDPAASTGGSYEVSFVAVNVATGETSWTLKRGSTILTSDESNQTGDENYDIYDGLFITVFSPSPGIGSVDRSVGASDGGPGGERWVSGVNWGGAWFFGGLDIGAEFFGSNLGPLDLIDMDIRWTSNPTMSEETGWSQGTVYRRDLGYVAESALGWMPMQAFDISDIDNPRRVNINFVEDANDGLADGIWNPIAAGEATGGGVGGREYTFFMASDYNPGLYDDANDGTTSDVVYALWPQSRSRPYQLSDFWIRIIANRPNTPNDKFTFTAPLPDKSLELEKVSAQKVGVFPNPYFAFNPQEINRLSRFVTFNNLPTAATIRIFNLAGQLVRTIDHESGQFERWDLLNFSNLPVASGMYIAHIEMAGVGVTKILKLGIIQEGEILETF